MPLHVHLERVLASIRAIKFRKILIIEVTSWSNGRKNFQERGYYDIHVVEAQKQVGGKTLGVADDKAISANFLDSGQYTINKSYKIMPSLGDEFGVKLFGERVNDVLQIVSENKLSEQGDESMLGLDSIVSNALVRAALRDNMHSPSLAGVHLRAMVPLRKYLESSVWLDVAETKSLSKDQIASVIESLKFYSPAGYGAIDFQRPAALINFDLRFKILSNWHFVTPGGYKAVCESLSRFLLTRGQGRTRIHCGNPVIAIERRDQMDSMSEWDRDSAVKVTLASGKF